MSTVGSIKINFFHRAGVLGLRSVRFADDIGFKFELFKRDGQRPELRAVDVVCKGQMLYLSLAAVHNL